MPKLCPHCGMESDTDRVCSWCGKSLETPVPDPGPQAQEAAPAPAGPPAPGRGKHAGAANALFAAERQRKETVVWPYYLIGGGVLLVIIVGALVAVYLRALRPPAEPGEWKTVTSHTKILSLEVPSNWTFSTAGSSGNFEWVTVKSGGLCKVRIEGSSLKGTLGDMASAAARAATGEEGNRVLTLEERAEGRLHATLGGKEVTVDPSFKDAEDLEACQFAGLPAACSHYTAVDNAGLFGVPIKGLRITAPGGGDYAYDIRLTAPEKVWDKFEPTALKILESVTRSP